MNETEPKTEPFPRDPNCPQPIQGPAGADWREFPKQPDFEPGQEC